ncbi:MAG: BatA domain-containing protein, partial [Phycisphaerales bacterium JB059]
MTVLHPILLATGLGLVAVPILIHILMRRKRKPVPWGAMRFLLEAYKTQRRRMTLEQMLLLAARCLLVALIALAVARPMLGGSGALGTSARTLAVLLDNSITSDLREGDRSALERHKAIAAASLDRLDPARGDVAALICLVAPARALALPPTADIAGVMRAIEA